MYRFDWIAAIIFAVIVIALRRADSRWAYRPWTIALTAAVATGLWVAPIAALAPFIIVYILAELGYLAGKIVIIFLVYLPVRKYFDETRDMPAKAWTSGLLTATTVHLIFVTFTETFIPWDFKKWFVLATMLASLTLFVVCSVVIVRRVGE